MMKLFLSLLSIAAVNAATKIAVIEAGVGGAVHRTTSTTRETSVDGTVSLVQAAHGRHGRLQHAGMTVVPDLFRKADSAIVVGISGSAVDLADLPVIAGLLEEEGKGGVVGHLEVDGSRCDAILSKVGEAQEVSDISSSVSEEAKKSGLSAVKMTVDESSNASNLDSSIYGLIADVDAQAKKDGKTVIIYLMVEEDAAVARRRVLSSRRLNDEVDANDNANADNKYQKGDNSAGFYGYGYFNDYGEWVTPYKSMFQIQYFNVVLWTSIGLTLVLISTIYLMMFMPMEPDTLLFGESAKMVGDD